MSNRVWVLGAQDTEMAAIEQLLADTGETVIYATIKGVRVHPGNAYSAELPLPEPGIAYYLVECGAVEAHPMQRGTHPAYTCDGGGGYAYTHCPEGGEKIGDFTVVSIDHHRPGDAGYGRPPEQYLLAASIGQVLAVLVRIPGKYGLHLAGILLAEHVSRVQIRMVAAADHCLEAAYRGRCPGIDPDKLMAWRAESRAAFQNRPVTDVVDDISAARLVLRTAITYGSPRRMLVDLLAPDHRLACMRDAATNDDEFHGGIALVADLRGEEVPELPEAACREGIPYLATMRDRDGREKVTLGAASPKLVTKFMAGEIIPGLAQYYGDPARGFAGGYGKTGPLE